MWITSTNNQDTRDKIQKIPNNKSQNTIDI